jgi:hypothetical protein
VFVLISKVESNPHCGHAISANLDIVGRHNAIDLLLEVVLGSIILVQFSHEIHSLEGTPNVKSSLPVSEVLNLHGDCIAANMFKAEYGPQSSFSFLWIGSSGKNFIKLRFGKVVSCTSLTEVS